MYRICRSESTNYQDLPSINSLKTRKKLSSFFAFSAPKKILAENEKELKVKKAEKETFKHKRKFEYKSQTIDSGNA